MANLNKVFLVGNLTRDPELKYTPQGSPVCNISIAVNRRWKGKDGQDQEEVSFFDVEAWGRVAETSAQYLKKGRSVIVEGRLKQQRWETQDGQKRSKVIVQADNIEFLGPPKEAAPDASAAPAAAPEQAASEPAREEDPF